MKNVILGLGVVAALVAVVVFAGSAWAAVAADAQGGNGLTPAPVKASVDAPADAPKADEPKKVEAKVRVDPKAALVTNALAAIAAAEKAVGEGNKEVATAELAKAKAALEDLQKSMLRDKLRENMQMRKLDGAANPGGDANAPAGRGPRGQRFQFEAESK